MATNRNIVSPRSRDRGERAVRAVFPPIAKVKTTRADRDVDFVVNGQPVEVKWIGAGNLGDVRSALKKRPKRNVILVGRQMSPGARAALSEAGVSWADETGAAEIAIGTILVSRTGVPEKKPHDIKHWTPAVITVTEALLCGTRGTQAAMQAVTGLSAGSCANALRFLTDEELLTSAAKRGPASARRVSDPRRLLEAYAAAVNDQPAGTKLQIGVSWQDTLKGVTDLGHHFDARKAGWALTGGAAAAAIAPFISSVSQATVYVEATSVAELKALAVSVKLRPIEGGRLTLKPFPSNTVQHLATFEDHDLRVAPWPRVYADLLKEGVRGEEAAEHLYEVVHERRNS
ncbi:MAG: type IV toxin-antitoxin system AbiEi family antitoxin [Gammaproteobacteria bacterium]|nr:type IV toxin-antitoxin system AbiEi family antitoxin [Gammaproteobacteria bacterium]